MILDSQNNDDDEKQKNLLEKIDRTINDINDKIAKANKRLNQLQTELQQATSKYDSLMSNRYSKIIFRCPTCILISSSLTLFLSLL